MTRTMTQACTFAAVLCGLTLVAGSAAAFEGKYVFNDGGYSQEAIITRAADGSYKVDVYVGVEGCSGAFTGVGRIEGADLVADGKEDIYACRLVISKTRTGVTIKEGDGCLAFHGASCEFNGTLHKR